MSYLTLILTAAREAYSSYEANFYLAKEKIMGTTIDFLQNHQKESEKSDTPPTFKPDDNLILVYVGIHQLYTEHAPAISSPTFQALDGFLGILSQQLKNKITGDFYREMLQIVDLIQKPEVQTEEEQQDLKSDIIRMLTEVNESTEVEEKIPELNQIFDISNLIYLSEKAISLNTKPSSPTNHNHCNSFLNAYFHEVCGKEKTAPSKETCEQMLSFLKRARIKLAQGVLDAFPSWDDFTAEEEYPEKRLMACIEIASCLRGARTLIPRMNTLLEDLARQNQAESPKPAVLAPNSAAAVDLLGIRQLNRRASMSVLQDTAKPGPTTESESLSR